MKQQLTSILLILAVIIILLAIMKSTANALAGVSIGDYLEKRNTILMPTIVANPEIKWTQADENKRIALEKAKEKKPAKDAVKVEKKQESIKEVKIDTSFDLDRLAKAVAMAETNNCTKGYGKTYNNCFGIKNGNTAPCPKIGKSKMCIYEKPEDSYEAFKKIWSKWYKTHPNLNSAQRWTGHDNAIRWLSHVNLHYNRLK